MNFISSIGNAAKKAINAISRGFGFDTEAHKGSAELDRRMTASAERAGRKEQQAALRAIRKEERRMAKIQERAAERALRQSGKMLGSEREEIAEIATSRVTVPQSAREKVYYNQARKDLLEQRLEDGLDFNISQADIEAEATRQRELYYGARADAVQREIERLEISNPNLSNPDWRIEDLDYRGR
jgi:hypothetical protein